MNSQVNLRSLRPKWPFCRRPAAVKMMEWTDGTGEPILFPDLQPTRLKRTLVCAARLLSYWPKTLLIVLAALIERAVKASLE